MVCLNILVRVLPEEGRSFVKEKQLYLVVAPTNGIRGMSVPDLKVESSNVNKHCHCVIAINAEYTFND